MAQQAAAQGVAVVIAATFLSLFLPNVVEEPPYNGTQIEHTKIIKTTTTQNQILGSTIDQKTLSDITKDRIDEYKQRTRNQDSYARTSIFIFELFQAN
jgi:hypothetical protein